MMDAKTFDDCCKILYLGDSLTNRTGVKDSVVPEKMFSTSYTGNFTEMVSKRLFVNYRDKDFLFYNKGISGDSLNDVLNRCDEVIELSPDIVVVMIGHNNVKNRDTDDFADLYDELIHRLSRTCKCIIGVSILPINHMEEYDRDIMELNEIIRQQLTKNGQLYLDVFEDFYDALRVCGKKMHLFEETNHLSEIGNILVSDRVYDAISKLI